MEYEAVIGLEVHVQLKTKTKAFCGCSTEFGQEPNTQVCPVCLGFPGSLPVLNRAALDCAIKVALALNCKVASFTKFDRKNYFYPDLPKNFQISQYDVPLSKDGFLEIDLESETKRVGITRVHLEEDAGKLIHKQDVSFVDFNRSGLPLLEIVSEPQISSADEAYEYLRLLKCVLRYLEVSDCDMEKGSLRCDANVSLRPKGRQELGVKTELKNMNSFKAVREGLLFEIERHNGALEGGKKIIQETRLWDAKELKTHPMRAKEGAEDYRYFPEPDLPYFTISDDKIEQIRRALPELPRKKVQRFISEYGLTEYDAKILAAEKKDAQYAEECISAFGDKDKKMVVNWLIGPLLEEANSRNRALSGLGVSADSLVELVKFVTGQEISNLTAKAVLTEMIETGKAAGQIIQEKGLSQISDAGILDNIAQEVIKENAPSVNDYKQGKLAALMFLVGQVMKKTKGKANPKVAQEILKRRL